LEQDNYDPILYIDVLEHIADDQVAVAAAAEKFRRGGHLIALSPAFPLLFSPFDAALGHYRRYTLASILGLAHGTLSPVRVRYLDAVGFLVSLSNRLAFKVSHPTGKVIRFWDRVLVPISRVVDPLLGYLIGRSILCIWQRK